MDSSKDTRKPLRFDDSTRALVSRLLKEHVRGQAWRILAAVLCMAVVAGTTAAFTQLIKPIVNDIFLRQQGEWLLPIALATLAVFVAKGLATYGQAVLMSYVGLRIVAEMQSRLFGSLIDADIGFYNKTSPGKLVSRFINDANMLRNAVSNTITGFGKDSLTAVALIGIMVYEDWLLALIAFVVIPTAIWPILRTGRRMRKVAGNTQQQVGILTKQLDEIFQGIRYVKAYGMEAYETKRAGEAIERVFRLNQKSARVRNILSPVMETLGGMAMVGVMLYGGYQVLSGARDPGSFFAFIFALLLAYEPIKRLAKLNTNLQEGLSAAHRLFTLIDMKPSIADRPGAKPLKVSGGRIALKDVHFAYEAGSPALNGVTLSVPAGKTAALVGASGAGKTTVLNLIPRFYDVTGGRVTIDDQDVREVTLASLRGQVALVSQETLLFDDSVRANIAYGVNDADQAAIEEAARHAGAHDFIAQLPQGYETQVGPRGIQLSGGQRQRIAIARAMLRNAPILLLDEATSALDTESERHVQAALAKLKQGRTTLVIAHRLSTIIDADLIYVLDDGRVIESGTHAELLAREGAYARLYRLQFAGAEGEPGSPDLAEVRARA